MEKIDAARVAFSAIKEFAIQNLENIESESDARFQLIDRILVEVLGWNRDAIKLEPRADSGYIDYLISSGGRNVFVLEAKRIEKVIVTTKLQDFKYYKVGGAALREAQEGIKQAAGYCSKKSVPFSALTNGIQWIGFRALRIDGVEFSEGIAATFPGLEAIEKNFAEFHDLFSQEGVRKRLYNVYLDRVEGSPITSVDPLVSAVRPEEIYLTKKGDLSRDLEQIFNEFFKTITGDSDEDLLAHCFVETNESREADRSLEKIARDIVSYVQTIHGESGNELRKEIESSLESKRGQVVLIVGNKGAGKTTFIDRFFRLKLDRALREKFLILKTNLAEASGSTEGIQEWLTDRLITAAEKALYDGKNPTYDELLGIFFDQYQRWSTGEHKHLYETNIDAFKIKFGEFIADRRRDKPNDYLTSILKRAIRQRSVVPCVVFDNADNFPIQFQDAVFQFAYSLYRAVGLIIVIVPITDRTIWRMSKAGALQSYSAKTLYLPIPSTKHVLEKRVQFIKRKLDEGDEKSKAYFSSRGLRVKMENMSAFAACVEQAFISTDFVARKIGSLTNFDIRRGLELSQKIITSSIIKVDELVSSYFAKREVSISSRRIVQALLFGDYNKFKQDSHEYVLNIFSPEVGELHSPLLRASILRLLLDRDNATTDELGAYMPFEEVERYFENMGVSTRTILAAVVEMVGYRIIEPYEPTDEKITPTTRIAITDSGRMHYEMCINDMVYFEQMALVTPIRSEKTIHSMREITAQKMAASEWGKIRKIFADYCISEDALMMSIPSHQDYSSQLRLRLEIKNWLS